jgi:hypothetical protein
MRIIYLDSHFFLLPIHPSSFLTSLILQGIEL